MILATQLVFCNTPNNPLNANLAKSLTRLCPEPSQLLRRSTEVPRNELSIHFSHIQFRVFHDTKTNVIGKNLATCLLTINWREWPNVLAAEWLRLCVSITNV